MIHDVITTANLCPYTCTANFVFDGARNNTTQKLRR